MSNSWDKYDKIICFFDINDADSCFSAFLLKRKIEKIEFFGVDSAENLESVSRDLAKIFDYVYVVGVIESVDTLNYHGNKLKYFDFYSVYFKNGISTVSSTIWSEFYSTTLFPDVVYTLENIDNIDPSNYDYWSQIYLGDF